MEPYRIDARGLSCPQPVMLVERALTAGKIPLDVIVDEPVAQENVMRLVTKRGFRSEITDEGSWVVIHVVT